MTMMRNIASRVFIYGPAISVAASIIVALVNPAFISEIGTYSPGILFFSPKILGYSASGSATFAFLLMAFIFLLSMIPVLYVLGFARLVVLLIMPTLVWLFAQLYLLPVGILNILRVLGLPEQTSTVIVFHALFWFLACLWALSGLLGPIVENLLERSHSNRTLRALAPVLRLFSNLFAALKKPDISFSALCLSIIVLAIPWLALLFWPMGRLRSFVSSILGAWKSAALKLVLYGGLIVGLAFADVALFYGDYSSVIILTLLVAFCIVHVLPAFVPEPDHQPVTLLARYGALGLGLALVLGLIQLRSWEAIYIGPLIYAICFATFLPTFALSVIAGEERERGKASSLMAMLFVLGLPAPYYQFGLKGEMSADARLRWRLEEAVREGRTVEASRLSKERAALLLEKNEIDAASEEVSRGIQLLGDLPFDRDVGSIESLQERRMILLDLMALRVKLLLKKNNVAEAEELALDTWSKAVKTQAWVCLYELAVTVAKHYESAGKNMDAYWWLADAKNRIRRGGGPDHLWKGLEASIAALREAIGEDAFKKALEECARVDPEWCAE